eukprot:PhM_4_TR18871/c0_g1_i1/m.14442
MSSSLFHIQSSNEFSPSTSFRGDITAKSSAMELQVHSASVVAGASEAAESTPAPSMYSENSLQLPFSGCEYQHIRLPKSGENGGVRTFAYLTESEFTKLKNQYYAMGGLRHGDVFTLKVVLSENGIRTTLGDGELAHLMEEVRKEDPYDSQIMHPTCFFNMMHQLKKSFMKTLGAPDKDTVDAYVATGGNRDKSGFVVGTRLAERCREFNLTIDIERLIEEIDTDGNGTVEYEEFETMLAGDGDIIEDPRLLFEAIGGDADDPNSVVYVGSMFEALPAFHGNPNGQRIARNLLEVLPVKYVDYETFEEKVWIPFEAATITMPHEKRVSKLHASALEATGSAGMFSATKTNGLFSTLSETKSHAAHLTSMTSGSRGLEAALIASMNTFSMRALQTSSTFMVPSPKTPAKPKASTSSRGRCELHQKGLEHFASLRLALLVRAVRRFGGATSTSSSSRGRHGKLPKLASLCTPRARLLSALERSLLVIRGHIEHLLICSFCNPALKKALKPPRDAPRYMQTTTVHRNAYRRNEVVLVKKPPKPKPPGTTPRRPLGCLTEPTLTKVPSKPAAAATRSTTTRTQPPLPSPPRDDYGGDDRFIRDVFSLHRDVSQGNTHVIVKNPKLRRVLRLYP